MIRALRGVVMQRVTLTANQKGYSLSKDEYPF